MLENYRTSEGSVRPTWHNWVRWSAAQSIWVLGITQFAISGWGLWLYGHPELPNAAEQKAVIGLLMTFISALILAAKFIKDRIPEPVIHEAIEELLEAAGRTLFNKSSDDETFYRVTLYKKVRFLLSSRVWTWNALHGFKPRKMTNWLVPIARSGEHNLVTRTIWWAGNSPKDFTNGFAGKAWNSRSRQSTWYPKTARSKIQDDEILPAITSVSTKDQREQYAALAYVPEKWIENKITEHVAKVSKEEADANDVILPRSFMSFPVNKGGKPWGVVVIDSDAEHFGTEQVHSVLKDVVYDILNKLLKGV